MPKSDEAKTLTELVDGMTDGDRQAMQNFFEFVDVLEEKKLKKDGRHALMMVVSVVELLLPKAARFAYAAASDRKGSRAEREKKTAPKKTGSKKKI